MFIEDHQWPYPHHPARPDAAGDGLDVDTTITVPVFQVRPGTWEAAAAWCGGTGLIINGGPAVLVNGTVAGLGDYLAGEGAACRAEQADGFHQRYQPQTAPPSG